MMKSKAGRDEVMNYVALLLNSLKKYEDEFGKVLRSYCNSCGRGEDAVFIISKRKFAYDEVAKHFLWLHYDRPIISSKILEKVKCVPYNHPV